MSWKPTQANSGSAQCQETPPSDEQNATATTWGAGDWLKLPQVLKGFLFIFSPRNSCPHSSRGATIQFKVEKSQKNRIPGINWTDQKLPILRLYGCSSEMVWFSFALNKQIQPYGMTGKRQIHWFDLKDFFLCSLVMKGNENVGGLETMPMHQWVGHFLSLGLHFLNY